MSGLIYEVNKRQYCIDSCLPQISAASEGKIRMHALTHGNYPGQLLPEHLLPGLSSLGVMDAVGEQDWGTEEHRNEGIEIAFQESGRNALSVDGKKYSLPAKALSVTRPWQRHRIGDPYLGPGRLHWIIIDVGVRRPNQAWCWPEWCILTREDLEELSRLLRGNEYPVWEADAEIMRVFQRLANGVTSSNPVERASRITIAINQLLIALLELLRSQRPVINESLSSVTRTVELFLEELSSNPDMLSWPWTLESMAEYCGLKRSSFAKYTHTLQNVTPIQYLNGCRLKYAAQRLIDEPQTSVTSIAFDLGIFSSQYFARLFKEQYSLTPSQWRQQHFKPGVNSENV